MTLVKKEAKSFLGQISKSNEAVYLILLSLYVAVFVMLEMGWRNRVEQQTDAIRYILLGIIMWGAALYLIYVIADWKNLWNRLPVLGLVAAAVLGLTYLFSKTMTTNIYGVVFDIYFCLMACGKSYKKILKCMASVVALALIIAGIGIPLKWTWNLAKPENVHPGHSLGIAYPNTWGFLCFFVLMIVWYLYMRRKKIATFILFAVASAFMWFYICCRTTAIFTALFPFMALLVDWLEDIADRNYSTYSRKPVVQICRWIVVIMPFLMLAFVCCLFINLEWVHKHFYFTWYHNLAMRFVVGGLFIRQYGVHLFGTTIKRNVLQYVNVNGDYVDVKILDSSFAAYLIRRGAIWMTYTLAWLCVGMWKALKKRDFAIPFLSVIILVFAMVERPGLEMWFNFIMLYPLAKVVSKEGTRPVLEFISAPSQENLDEDILPPDIESNNEEL